MPTTTQTVAKAGAKSIYGLAKETTFATAVAPSLYIEPINPQFTPDNVLVQRSGIRNTIDQTTPGIGRVDLKGSFEVEALPDTIGLQLALAMGVDTFTAGSGGTAGTGTHVLKLGNPLNTVTFSADFGAGTVHQYVGCKFNSLDLTVKQSSFLLAKFGLVGVKDTQLTSSNLAGSATFSVLPNYLFEHITSATLDSVAFPLDSLNVSLKTNVKPRWYGGTGRYPGAMDEAERKVTGSFSAAYVDETLYNLLATPNGHNLSLTFTSPASAAGSNPYSLTITMANISIESIPVDPKRNDVTMYSNIKFSAYESASGLQDALKITVVDTAVASYV